MLNPATVLRLDRRSLRHVRLADGARVSVRPIRAEDADEFARAYTRLSELSRQRRFLSLAPALRPAEVRYLTSVDHHEHVALVAVGPDGEDILGSARYIRLPNRHGVAEMAIEVIDDWQQRGVGRALLDALSHRARASGVKQFVALVAADNLPMQLILKRAGATARMDDGELEYTVDVDALARHDTAPPRMRQPTAPRGVALGITLGAGYSLSALAFAASLRHIEAGLADVLLFAYPVMVSVGAVMIGRERWSARRAAALSVAGVGIAGALSGGGTGTIDPAGVSLALAAALIYAAYVLASGAMLRRMDPLVLAASVATGAALVFCGYAVARGEVAVDTGAEGLGLVIAVALSSSVIGTAAFMAGVRALGASRASIISSAEPALTALFSWVAFGDEFGAVQLLGAVLLLASVPILELRRTHRPKRPGGRRRCWPTPGGALQPSRSPA